MSDLACADQPHLSVLGHPRQVKTLDQRLWSLFLSLNFVGQDEADALRRPIQHQDEQQLQVQHQKIRFCIGLIHLYIRSAASLGSRSVWKPT